MSLTHIPTDILQRYLDDILFGARSDEWQVRAVRQEIERRRSETKS